MTPVQHVVKLLSTDCRLSMLLKLDSSTKQCADLVGQQFYTISSDVDTCDPPEAPFPLPERSSIKVVGSACHDRSAAARQKLERIACATGCSKDRDDAVLLPLGASEAGTCGANHMRYAPWLIGTSLGVPRYLFDLESF
jgi:hypothetical protein